MENSKRFYFDYDPEEEGGSASKKEDDNPVIDWAPIDDDGTILGDEEYVGFGNTSEEVQQAEIAKAQAGIETEINTQAKPLTKGQRKRRQQKRNKMPQEERDKWDLLDDAHVSEESRDLWMQQQFKQLVEKHGEREQQLKASKEKQIAVSEAQRKASVVQLQTFVPAQGNVLWNTPRAKNSSFSSGYSRIQQIMTRIHTGIRRVAPPLDPVYQLLWNAAARPPWPACAIPEEKRPSVSLATLGHIIRQQFSAEPAVFCIIRQRTRMNPLGRIGMICDYYLEESRLCLAVILQPANAEAESLFINKADKTPLSEGTGLSLVTLVGDRPPEEQPQAADPSVPTPKTQPSQWRYVGMTLTDQSLNQIETS